MSHPSSLIRTALLLTLSLALSACGTMYTRTFSPQRDYYAKLPEKVDSAAAELPPETTETTTITTPGPGPVSQPPVQAPAPGALDPAQATMPGL
jgi:hypothetical protein